MSGTSTASTTPILDEIASRLGITWPVPSTSTPATPTSDDEPAEDQAVPLAS